MSTFGWTAGTLTGGVDAQASIVALNQLYSGAAVAANAEWVGRVDLEQIGGLIQQAGDCDVFHESKADKA